MTMRPIAELRKVVSAERRIAAPAPHLYRIIADFNEHHAKFRAEVTEPEPGRVLVEEHRGNGTRTAFTVTPDGAGALVRIESEYRVPNGVLGFVAGLLTQPVLRRLLAEELARLDVYARSVPV